MSSREEWKYYGEPTLVCGFLLVFYHVFILV